MEHNTKIAIIGFGYVGLPLAVAFAEKYSVIGFDINQARVKKLMGGHDFTLEVSDEYNLTLVEILQKNCCHSVIHTFPHDFFTEINFKEHLIENGVLFNIMAVLPKILIDSRL